MAVFKFSKSYTNCLQRKAIRTFYAIHVVLTKTPSNFLELKKLQWIPKDLEWPVLEVFAGAPVESLHCNAL